MSEIKSIYQRLADIQNKIKVSKSQYNPFGKFKYRNAEDILNAAKPLAYDQNCAIVLNDEIVEIGGNIYMKATATLIATDLAEGENSVTVSAFAKEPLDKKGMDASQITGASSSYARKYAMCGLFAIDDGQDNDAQDNRPKSQAPNDEAMYQPKKSRIYQIRAKLLTIKDVESMETYRKELNLKDWEWQRLKPYFTARRKEIEVDVA